MLINKLKVAFAALFLVVSVTQASENVLATVLLFDDVESGVEPYVTRYLISGEHLRIDEGRAQDSFVLYNANSGVLYSISHSDQSILKIPPKKSITSPELQNRFEKIETRLKRRDDTDGPKIAGLQAIEYELNAGAKICARFSSVDGLLQNELKVLRAYQKALVSNNARNIGNQPAEYITDCMLVNELYAADLYLSKGFPVMSMFDGGLQRFLKNYSLEKNVASSLFVLPDAYTEFFLESKIGL